MYNVPIARPSLFGRILGSAKNFNFGSFLDGTQKTLGVINQAIPIVYQVKPIFTNARTMFKIADEINKPTSNFTKVTDNNVTRDENINKPIFYI